MRRVDLKPCPGCLGPESRAARETGRAIEHFRPGAWKRGSRFRFSAYDTPELREALLEAFDGVCAYCETPLASMEIEHFRPKGDVQTKEGRRGFGYYWLANTWENLLPSCPECNSDRYRQLADGSVVKTGKGNWFPLEDEGARASEPEQEKRERALLLHPYEDEPADHLEFVEDAFVRARRDTDGMPSRCGETTIELLGLNRRGLFEARRDRRLVLEVRQAALMSAIARLEQDPYDEVDRAAYDDAKADLEDLVRPGAGYNGMAAQFLGLSVG